ncbi:hypothetical protein KL86DPRO_20049 [uncultured delta proteobacterium]|uniref:Uncharacterized protein n=1 Tax=uncultured delta proteobacterium TaxID=34034 RepID=A0A212JTY5_9DELT|nr:hypothetical protein KL86DPRO_20049 [uncultured delta proteobacterium]
MKRLRGMMFAARPAGPHYEDLPDNNFKGFGARLWIVNPVKNGARHVMTVKKHHNR